MNTQNDFLDNAGNVELEIDNTEDLNVEMCSYMQSDTEKMCSYMQSDTCGNNLSAKPYKIRIYKKFVVAVLWVCHPFATHILKSTPKSKNKAVHIELFVFQPYFWIYWVF